MLSINTIDERPEQDGQGGRFRSPDPLKTAVLFLAFNRPEATNRVLGAIRRARPPRLYVAADGARMDRPGEVEKINAVRRCIMSGIDWECEVKTLFRETNLGCKYAVSGAVTWFFENEDQGIILEDDCLPSQSFFWFCEHLLMRYRADRRVGHISGYNHFPFRVQTSDYFFSLIPGIWGWATWADRWRDYDVEMENYPSYPNFVNRFSNRAHAKYWVDVFSRISDIDTWDYQWAYTLLSNGYLAIRPSSNLVTNIGFSNDATHTVSHDSGVPHNLSCEIDVRRLMPPGNIVPDVEEDNLMFRERLSRSMLSRVLRRLKSAILL